MAYQSLKEDLESTPSDFEGLRETERSIYTAVPLASWQWPLLVILVGIPWVVSILLAITLYTKTTVYEGNCRQLPVNKDQFPQILYCRLLPYHTHDKGHIILTKSL